MGQAILQAANLDRVALVTHLRAGDEVVLMDGDRCLGRFFPEAQGCRPLPRFGSLKGRITLDESFWDPLPEDEQRLWDGYND